MTSSNDTRARAVADLTEGLILASVEVVAAPERVFRALASKEITEWWVRPGVFDTREWSGGRVRRWSLASVGHDEGRAVRPGRPVAVDVRVLAATNRDLDAAIAEGSFRKDLASDLSAREKAVIENALRQASGRVSGANGAAAILGMPRQTLESKLKKLGIKPYQFRAS